jgi:nitrate/nitrite transporter NarK
VLFIVFVFVSGIRSGKHPDGPLIWVRLFLGVAHHKGPGNGAIFRVNSRYSRPTMKHAMQTMQTIFNLACWHHLEPS